MKYDFLIVGSGLFGATFAYEASKKGKKCLVIDKRPHLGGNIYTENVEGINVHKYGAHIFHTNDKSIWEYIQQFAEFNRFTNSPLAIFKDEQYNLPFNMNTFHQLWGVKTPNDAKKIIEEQIARENIKDPQNLEEQAISLVGRDIYEKLIKGYTEKQWGRDAKTIPAFIIKRLPVRYTYDNNYFNDKYQGIPIGGYTQIIEKMLHGIETSLNTDFFKDRHYYESIADKILFTGMIDEYFNYKFGELEYRSLKFENNLLNVSNFQGNAVVNYTEKNIEYTRIIEHKHFEFGEQDKTVITKEYPADWKRGDEPYYPINDSKNTELYIKYMKLAEGEKNVIFGGRLGMYKYFDMHHILAEALKCVSHHVE
ncbi:UDP-galactopyranose mutase [Klebsiella quasipneumoniae]|uniref:UDP-galactopyranose mutase n=1 Tax=Klebsiella quasipneumoniae TaxID=1463165 RepID=UPI0023AEA68F|nr:UDP-galactopyranose mutase [Klebsiella quasipneumoniae]HBW8875714.1 UDP-galactopyranose mutase [Klebsiella quasipneumoniae subsp. similipneumoniae]